MSPDRALPVAPSQPRGTLLAEAGGPHRPVGSRADERSRPDREPPPAALDPRGGIGSAAAARCGSAYADLVVRAARGIEQDAAARAQTLTDDLAHLGMTATSRPAPSSPHLGQPPGHPKRTAFAVRVYDLARERLENTDVARAARQLAATAAVDAATTGRADLTSSPESGGLCGRKPNAACWLAAQISATAGIAEAIAEDGVLGTIAGQHPRDWAAHALAAAHRHLADIVGSGPARQVARAAAAWTPAAAPNPRQPDDNGVLVCDRTRCPLSPRHPESTAAAPLRTLNQHRYAAAGRRTPGPDGAAQQRCATGIAVPGGPP